MKLESRHNYQKGKVAIRHYAIQCESASRHFQPGEGPSRGLLRDYEPSDGPSFQALVDALHTASLIHNLSTVRL